LTLKKSAKVISKALQEVLQRSEIAKVISKALQEVLQRSEISKKTRMHGSFRI